MRIKRLLRVGLYPLLVTSLLTIPVVFLSNSKFEVMAQTRKLPSRYLGTWNGNGIQNNGSQWSIQITLASDSSIGSVVGTIAYPSLRCGGELVLMGVDSNYVKLHENLTFGKNLCFDGGTVILQPTSSAMKYLWFYPQGSPGAHGIVYKQQLPTQRREQKYSYGSIAVFGYGSYSGYSWNYPSREEAINAALEECFKSSRGRCRTAISFRNGCGALATKLATYGAAYGPDELTAQYKALEKCGDSCRIERVICNGTR